MIAGIVAEELSLPAGSYSASLMASSSLSSLERQTRPWQANAQEPDTRDNNDGMQDGSVQRHGSSRKK